MIVLFVVLGITVLAGIMTLVVLRARRKVSEWSEPVCDGDVSSSGPRNGLKLLTMGNGETFRARQDQDDDSSSSVASTILLPFEIGSSISNFDSSPSYDPGPSFDPGPSVDTSGGFDSGGFDGGGDFGGAGSSGDW